MGGLARRAQDWLLDRPTYVVVLIGAAAGLFGVLVGLGAYWLLLELP